ncbi:MAG: hypothetical protein ABW061_09410 [Polyangiaceae bacterium]
MSPLPASLLALSVFAQSVLLSACATSGAPDAASPATPGSLSRAAAIGSVSGAPGKTGPGIVADCSASAVRTDGRFRYENNQWGAHKTQNKFEQCLLTRERGGKTEVGWTWNWPGFDPSVFAYPEIIVGWKPWSGGASTDARFPLKVAEVKNLTLSYEVETTVSGSYDLAPELWLTNAGATSQANPQSITTEVMFWMDHTDGARPAGSIVGTVTQNGLEYELWREEKIGVDANGKGWRLLSFKSPKAQHQATLDIAALLRHLLESKLISADDYVASVEFGNEVMGGSGTTWVKQFDVRLD